MGLHEDKIELLRKYHIKISTGFEFLLAGDIPSKKIDNAISKFASGIDRKSIIGFYDTTILGSGKNGYIFTDSKVYYLETLEKPNKLWYEDICRISIIDKEKTNDCDRKIKFELYDGTNIIWDSIFLNKTPLLKFFTELLLMDNKNIKQKSVEKLNYNSKIGYGSISGGIGSANYHTVNKLFDEEKFHANQGHGYAAERANNLFDNVRGHDAKIVGDNNIKNGADRILDGIQIQSKYCATGSRCINACFTEEGKGTFR